MKLLDTILLKSLYFQGHNLNVEEEYCLECDRISH